jgi:gamma-glutamyltranspeptidase/glutathione hydrolase
VLVNLLDHGMEPQQALDAPRYRLEEDGSVSLEPPLAARADAFGGRAARVVDDGDNFGNAHLIVRDGDVFRGGSEPRRDGLALGV